MNFFGFLMAIHHLLIGGAWPEQAGLIRHYIIIGITAPLAGLQVPEMTAQEPNSFSSLLQHNV